MNTETRPNIVTIGLIAGAVVQMILWAWNGWLIGMPPMTGAEGAALTTILTAALQWLDRLSKRASDHVLTKYGEQ